jgi:uncharacterized surface protein with fasciclin (FAS1) repeats
MNGVLIILPLQETKSHNPGVHLPLLPFKSPHFYRPFGRQTSFEKMIFIIKDKIILYYLSLKIQIHQTMKHLLSITLGIAVTALIAGCSSQPTQEASLENLPVTSTSLGQSGVKDDVSSPNVVQVAVGSSDHSTLVAALKAANYVDALSNVGPFTVFAPTNAAFDLLPAGTVDNLVKSENQRKLRDILEYHVLLGVYKQEDFVNGRNLGTADGRNVIVAVENGSVLINGAKIIGTVQASNGIIHVIDQVLIPAEKNK